VFLRLSDGNPIPQQVLNEHRFVPQNEDSNQYTAYQEYEVIQEIVRYTQDTSNLVIRPSMTLQEFAAVNEQQIQDEQLQNEQICGGLDLESEQCYYDCIYYVSPLSLLANDTEDGEFIKVLSWYQMGGGALGWFDIGNPDMCSYSDGTYCFTPISLPAQGSPMGAMNIQEHGCCVPGSCQGEDAVKVLQQNTYCYQSYVTIYRDTMFGGMFNVTDICEPLERDFDSAGFWIVILIMLAFLACITAASIRTQYLSELEAKNLEISEFHLLRDQLRNAIDEDNEHSPSHKREGHNKLKPARPRNVYDDHWFLQCFSIQHLWKIFTARRPADKSQFNFLDGIRVASMSWVIYGHVYILFLMSSPSNQATMMPFSADAKPYPYEFTKFYMMFAEYAFYSVDSFFYLSGFLAAFAIYRQLERYGVDKNGRSKAIRLWYTWIPLAYINRVLRLLPMMTFVMMVQWFVADQLPYSYRVTSRDANAQLCSNSWYAVLFFYANLKKDMDDLGCMGHLWYIQCDMQMYLLLPFLVLLFKWKKVIGVSVSFLLFLAGIGVRTYNAIHYHFGANFLQPANEFINDGSQQEQYFKPWTRMAPYFVGVFTMFIILTLKDKKLSPKPFEIHHRSVFFSIMALGMFTMCCLVFWPYNDIKDAPEERWSLAANQAYYAMSRPAWGAALGLLSFAIVMKAKYMRSLTDKLLSAEIYQPLGKLTYSMYLIHWMMLQWFFADLNTATYYEYWWVLSIFAVIWLLTMSFTVVLWFLIEQPMANVIGLAMKTLVGKLSGKRASKQKTKTSMDSELAHIKHSVVVLGYKKTNNQNGRSIKDKLLVSSRSEGNENTTSTSFRSDSAAYGNDTGGGRGSYETFMEANADNEQYDTMKSLSMSGKQN